MKKILSVLLILSLLLCSVNVSIAEDVQLPAGRIPEAGFSGLNDPNLLRYTEDTIYESLVTALDSEKYFVENVSAVYISQEYIDELAYNSQANIYFGFTLQEIAEEFQGKKYVFTLGDDGKTIVTEFENYDDTYDRALKNVAVGTGVILICVTVSVVSGGLGAPAVSMVFAASAKTGTIMALSGGAFGGISAGIITGIETGDMDEALKAAALAGSEGYKWGAISGAVSGGISEGAVIHKFKGVDLNGLSLQEAVKIQKESGYSVEIIKKFKNMEQYNRCKEMGLVECIVDGKASLVQRLDLDTVIDEYGHTNRWRILNNQSPIDLASGETFELHHLGQEINSPLVVLTKSEHRLGDSYGLWHEIGLTSGVHANNPQWPKQVHTFWKQYLKVIDGGI